MSAVLQIAGYSADILSAGHDDAMTLLPGGQVVSGYADELVSVRDPERWFGLQARLSTGPVMSTHTVNIRRSLLTVDTKTITSIRTADGRIFRVRDYMDSPADPCVSFFCNLA